MKVVPRPSADAVAVVAASTVKIASSDSRT
jgi:hypothetical protein